MNTANEVWFILQFTVSFQGKNLPPHPGQLPPGLLTIISLVENPNLNLYLSHLESWADCKSPFHHERSEGFGEVVVRQSEVVGSGKFGEWMGWIQQQHHEKTKSTKVSLLNWPFSQVLMFILGSLKVCPCGCGCGCCCCCCCCCCV